ncbi:LINE-1 retrotransposable element ORF2 protein isoform X1 [Zeugodacus cucurbitae]|uniref:LINE-1 retrotransposable element ORF2 protein isoform X1 n=1 Tax=Zeugodacus cucurbitae TaxID=28588 RepID=UPI0023D904AC|nr:LINE-1 retrotransposable element ORF2 protein isoform X1 [Zeugodacus cucurbitae]XP_054085667.1 LINE-1 retrotransposable element ORF2 protein isoform X1 [Zeugodacus cucurbitae]XP_054085668.1 LINE-1 retrotransposable element ORF2 protein isoform X1 [Zeugodacus cucurbitae]
MVVCSTRFQHKKIHQATWLSPDRNTRNQIDHVVIDGRHVSCVLDVRTLRGPNIDSDHYLVAAKIRTRLCAAKNARQQTQGRFDVEKLQSQQTATKYSTRLALLLSESTHQHLGIRELWNGISNSLRTAAAETIGFRQRQKTSWYDEECRLAAERKQTAYLATLQTTTTRAGWDRYRELKREARRICRQKKKEAEMREYEELEKLADRGNARKFYEKMKRLNEGFKTGASSCRDQGGNLVTDVQGILGLWREHFSDLLNGSESTTPGDGEPDPPIDDDGTDVPLPDHEEIRIAITRLKNNKAAGADRLPAELFKYGGEELIRCMHQLLCRIWSEESMPDDWNLSVLCPIHKKGDPTICANYRGISLLNIAYKVLSSVLCERLKPTVNKLIGPYQCGFRPGKSTTDQIFTMRQILEKTREKRIDTHHLFVDFKAAFDSTKRSCLYAAMSEFDIPAKLIRLCKLTLSNTKSSVMIGKDLSEPFDTKRGFRQGDSLSCDFFNLMLEKIIRAAELNREGTIFYKSVQLLAYADDIDIIGSNNRAVCSAFSRMDKEAKRMGLEVNEDKTKYLLSSNKQSAHSRLGSHVTVDSHNFEVVDNFVYLGTSINNTNNVSLEIQRRITLANRCYFGLSRQLNSKVLSRRTKIKLYKSLIIPVLLYGAEAWTMSTSDETTLGVFERKILRKIYGPQNIGNGEYRRRWNDELYELYDDIDIVQRIKRQRLRWLGHVVRMDENTPALKVFDAVPAGGSRGRGRPPLRWRDQVESDLVTLGISNWRRTAKERDRWRTIVDSAITG